MADTSNIRIITSLGELAYRNGADLGISFSRIVDDFTDLSNRFQDFSYDFELPYLKANSLVFGAPEALGSKKYFPINQSIDCQVYLNNELLLDGLINLEGLTNTGYKCKFYSKFKELIDSLEAPNADGSDRTLRDLKFPVVENWNYEESLIAHQQANYKNSDETFYQFPLCKYSTFYTQENLYHSGNTRMYEAETRRPIDTPMFVDNTKQNFYIFINSNWTNNTVVENGLPTTGHTINNRVYIHQVPPAVYLVSIVKQIISDAGWKLGGQFFENKDIKRIIYTYAGDEDIYDQATEQVSGSTAVNLQIAKFLPEDSQVDFLKSVINMFNLYIKVDVTNKIVSFETYNTLFGDSYNPYDITSKVDVKSVEFLYETENNPSIVFEKANNQNIMGDNYVMSNNTNNAYQQQWVKTSKVNYKSFFNRIGTTDEIKIEFAEPNVCRQFIYNDVPVDELWGTLAGFHTIYLPCLTKQTPTDNESRKFNKNSGDTYLNNSEDTIKFAGKGSMMFYYGPSITNFENKSGKGSISKYMYYNMYTASGTTLNKVKIPVVSPFQLFNHRTNINNYLASVNPNNYLDRRTTTATYLQSLWQLMGQSQNISSEYTTDFSLVFDDNGYFHDTLWSKFHKTKYDRYQNSEMLKARMRMDAVDWNEMQIERPVLYNKEIYNIVSIEGYNPIQKTADITLIKKL